MNGLIFLLASFVLIHSSESYAKSCMSALSDLIRAKPKVAHTKNADLKKTKSLLKAWNQAYQKTMDMMRSHVFLSTVHKLDSTSFEIFSRVSTDPKYVLSHFEKKWLKTKGLTERVEAFRNTWGVIKGANWARAALTRHKPSDFTKQSTILDGLITSVWQGVPNVFFSPILMPSRFFGSEWTQARMDRIYRTTALKAKFDVASASEPMKIKSAHDLLELVWIDSKGQKRTLKKVSELWERYQKLQEVAQLNPKAYTQESIKKLNEKIIQELDGLVSPKDVDYLLSKNRLADFIRFAGELKHYQTSHMVLSGLKHVGKILRWSLILTGTTMAASSLLEDDEDPQLNRDSVFDPSVEGALNPEDNIVELFFLSPMPHISLRVGGVVMDYGHGDATLSSLQGYKDSLVSSQTASFYRVEIKTTPEQFQMIQAVVVDDSFRTYQYMLPFNNCVYQVNRVLCDAGVINVPSVLNQSQGFTLAYLKSLKLTNDPRIGSISYVSLEDDTRFNDRLAFVGITAIDTLFFGYHAGKNIVLNPFLKPVQKMSDEPEIPEETTP